MDVRLHHPADRQRLTNLAPAEADAKQRDRYRAVLLAVDGQQAPRIAAALGRSRRFVQRWACAYRDGWTDALVPGKSPGRPTTPPRGQEQAFRRRVLSGPDGDADGGVCVLRGEGVRRILEREFDVAYSPDGAYHLLARLRISCLAPRPRHRKNDPQAMRDWLDGARLLSGR